MSAFCHTVLLMSAYGMMLYVRCSGLAQSRCWGTQQRQNGGCPDARCAEFVPGIGNGVLVQSESFSSTQSKSITTQGAKYSDVEAQQREKLP